MNKPERPVEYVQLEEAGEGKGEFQRELEAFLGSWGIQSFVLQMRVPEEPGEDTGDSCEIVSGAMPEFKDISQREFDVICSALVGRRDFILHGYNIQEALDRAMSATMLCVASYGGREGTLANWKANNTTIDDVLDRAYKNCCEMLGSKHSREEMRKEIDTELRSYLEQILGLGEYGPCPVCGGNEFKTFTSVGEKLPYENGNGVCCRCHAAAKENTP